jgi:DNA-binding transcriptional MerR regulator
MLTVTKLARACGLSRSTLLYYEAEGLLSPPVRSAGNYRCYSDRDLVRLRQICAYRDAGLSIGDIRALLDRPLPDAAPVLERRLVELNAEIENLRGQQKAILALMQNRKIFRKGKVMTKEKWTSIMKATGFTEDEMRRWHVEFERAAPEDHQQFLEYLQIGAEEIGRIRGWSRGA